MLASLSSRARWRSSLCAGVLLLGFSPTAWAELASEAPPTEAPASPPASPAPRPEAGTAAPAASPPSEESPATVPGPPPVAPVVVAQAKAPASEAARPYSLGVTLASSLQSETGSTSFVTAPLIEGAYVVHPMVVLDLTLGFAWLLDNQGLGESTFRAGDPMLSGYYRDQQGPLRFHVGLGVTAPLAEVPMGPDGRLYESLYNRTLAMWGMWNQWLWLRGRVSLPLSMHASYTLPGILTVAGDMAAAVVFGVANGAGGTQVLAQLALEAQIPLGSRFALCPRFQSVLLPSTSIDRAQTAAGLRGTYATRVGRFFAGFLVNLDEPVGGLVGGTRWAFQLGKEIDL